MRLVVVVLVCAVAFLSAPARAQCESTPLLPPTPAEGDGFGYDVAVSGDWTAIGAPFEEDDGFGIQHGAIYLYQRSGINWIRQQRLLPDDLFEIAWFGASVALAGDLLVIGAPFDGASGRIYVYERRGSTWVLVARIDDPSPPAVNEDAFGFAVATDGRTIVVGDHEDNTAATLAGAVFVYEKLGGSWASTATLLSSDAEFGDSFGYDVAVSGDWIAIDSLNDADAPYFAGVVYTFRREGSGWTESQKLVASNAAEYDSARQIALDGQTLFLGASQEIDVPAGAGSVFVFRESNGVWSQTQTLVASDATVGDVFGSALSIDGTRALVGAPGDDNLRGAVYQLELVDDAWIETRKLVTLARTSAQSGEYYGDSVALCGEEVVVGAWVSDGVFHDEGAAYTHLLDELECRPLSSEPGQISLSHGGNSVLEVSAGAEHGSSSYWIVGSVSGNAPGFALGGMLVPINPDDYFASTLTVSPGSPLLNNSGVLDAEGKARALFGVPPASDPALAGLVVWHACVGYELAPLRLTFVSNPSGILLEL